MPERQTKKQRIDEAREAARLAREKREKRQKLMKWLVPTLVSAAVLGIAAIVVAVIILIPPQGAYASPANMRSDGIAFEGSDGEIVPVETPARSGRDEPAPTDWDSDVPHIQLYVDWTCPACKGFEEQYGAQIEELVAAGDATLEVFPVAILEQSYQNSGYSDSAANTAACVANFAPERFLEVEDAMFAGQGEEGTPGLTDAQILEIVGGAGADDDEITDCVEGGDWDSWVQNATRTATSDEDLQGPQGFSTPTALVNGEQWDRQTDFLEFVQQAG